MTKINLENTFSNISAIDSSYFLNRLEISEKWKKTFLSPNSIALSLVILLHITLLFGIMADFRNNNDSSPILSFTITKMDLSATSSNVVSSAAANASSNKEKSEKSLTEANFTNNDAPNSTLTKQEDSAIKSKTAQSNNSIQQNAVIATKAAIYDAAYLNNPSPNYPAISKRLGEQGMVTLNVLVDVDGKAKEVVIKNSSGHARLDEAALATVKKWHFLAAKQGLETVASWVIVPINFVLEK